MDGTSTSKIEPRKTFKKEERLTSKKLMDELFNKGSSIYFEPIRLVWLETTLPSTSPAQVVFSVPKKSFPRAVDRNLVKRLMREAYRLNKHSLYLHLKQANKIIAVAFIYGGKKIMPYAAINDKIILALSRLISVTGPRA